MGSSAQSGPPDPIRPGRTYDGTLRRERAAETRERVVAAACALLHRAPIRDWKGLTVRAVAQRAGVNERTVYRHFGNERGLRDAVMHRLEEEAGIDLEGMGLADIGKVASQIFQHVSSYPVEPRPPLDPTLVDANQRQKAALLGAVEKAAEQWHPDTQVLAAAMFDVLWSVATYERLVSDWQIDLHQALQGVTWVVELIEQAIRDGRAPL